LDGNGIALIPFQAEAYWKLGLSYNDAVTAGRRYIRAATNFVSQQAEER
jgi:hypothetical protein